MILIGLSGYCAWAGNAAIAARLKSVAMSPLPTARKDTRIMLTFRTFVAVSKLVGAHAPEAVANYRDSKLIIDLIRLPSDAVNGSRNYTGICW